MRRNLIKSQEPHLNDEKHIQYSVIIANNSEDKLPIPARFEESRTSPIIKNLKMYHLSITRFSVPMNLLPIHYFLIDESQIQNDPNKGVWAMKIGNSTTGQEFSTYVEYTPQNSSIPTPLPPSSNNGKQAMSQYYYVFSYDAITKMLNKTLSDLYDLAGLGASIKPIFYFKDGKFTLVINESFLAGGINEDWNNIYVNFPLYSQCLGAFNYVFETSEWLKFDISPDLYYPKTQLLQLGDTAAVPFNYIEITQSFVYAPQYLSFVDKIVLTSSSMKARRLLISSNNLSSPSIPVIFTFEPDLSQIGIAQDKLIYYNPNWKTNTVVDLLGDDALYNIDLQLYINDSFGNLWPLYIGWGNSVDIEFLFYLKEYF